MLKRLRSFVRVLRSRQGFEENMDQELRFHIEQYAEELMASGLTAQEAERRARMELGALPHVKAECREARGLQVWDELVRELRYAARLLRKSPGFAFTALLTLAVCLGANLTIFAVVDSVLLRPLPFPDSRRLITMYNTYPKAGVLRDGSSLTNYYERRGHIFAFSSLSIYRFGTALVGEGSSTQLEQITQVSPEFFTTLGRGPVLGRAFTEQETTYKTDSEVILTDAYWREHCQAYPRILGRSIRVNGHSVTVVGILPAGFRFLSSKAALYFPLSSNLEQRAPSERHSGGNSIQMIGRLKSGATLAQAQAQIDAQNSALEVDDPQGKMMAAAGFRTLLVPLHADHVASVRPMLLLLQAGVLVLLLIGIANLVNLLLIRAHGRAKESAVRKALGASRAHVLSEVMVETIVLSGLGGLLGLALAMAGIRLITLYAADHLPLGSEIAFTPSLALTSLAAVLIVGTILALPVVWINLRGTLSNPLQSESRSATGSRSTQRLRHGFIVAQIALSFVLLAGAGLLSLSLKHAMDVSPGFHAAHLLTGWLSLTGNNYPNAASGVTFTEKLVQNLESKPGVSAAGIANNIPFSGNTGKSAATVKGYVLRPGESPRGHYSYGVTGDYFTAMGIPLVSGRYLTGADSRRARQVCVVDLDFARHYWPDENPLGHLLFQGSSAGKDSEAFTVVGVVGRVQQAGLTDEEPQGAVYYPYAARPSNEFYVIARTTSSPDSFAPALRTTVRSIDPELPVNQVQAMDTRISESLSSRRSPALLAGIFSAIALLLTVIGTYGVLSYAVSQRRREIGVRMALGAQPAQIRTHFLTLALRLLAAGVVIGLSGAWAAGRAMQAVLFHVPSLDVPMLTTTALVLVTVSLAACLLPSLRAARVSPVEALSE